jgi:acyl-CoA thioesterase-1
MKKISCFSIFFCLVLISLSPGLAAQPAASETPVVLVLGDSLSASFGIDQSNGWVSLLEQKLTQNDYHYRVINASISGETTQGGLQRLPKLLTKYHPQLVILELGGNDGLRGLSIDLIKSNLQTMISQTLQSHANLLLVGMRLPPNYGQFYTDSFSQMYVDLARTNKIPVVPFLLADIATRENLMQVDGIHPREEAQSLMLDNVWKHLQPLLAQPN